MKALFKRVWSDIKNRRNLELYLVLIAVVIVFIVDLLGVESVSIIFEVVLATLAVLLYGQIDSRHSIDEIKLSLREIAKSRSMSDQFFAEGYNFDEIRDCLSTSNAAFFWGLTFTKTIELLDYTFEEKLRAGQELRFLVLKPDSAAVEMAALRHIHLIDQERWNLVLQAALLRLADIASLPNISGNLEVRVIDYLPSWTVIAADPKSDKGKMFVQFTTFKSPDEKRPTFQLAAISDKEWFHFFVEQFDNAWKVGEPFDLKTIRMAH